MISGYLNFEQFKSFLLNIFVHLYLLETNMPPSRRSEPEPSLCKGRREIARRPSFSSPCKEAQISSRTWGSSTRSEKRTRDSPPKMHPLQRVKPIKQRPTRREWMMSSSSATESGLAPQILGAPIEMDIWHAGDPAVSWAHGSACRIRRHAFTTLVPEWRFFAKDQTYLQVPHNLKGPERLQKAASCQTEWLLRLKDELNRLCEYPLRVVNFKA